jgi:hypothetical protein
MDNLSVCSSVGTRQAANLFQLTTQMAPGQEIQRMAKRRNGAGTEHTSEEADERNLADRCHLHIPTPASKAWGLGLVVRYPFLSSLQLSVPISDVIKPARLWQSRRP